MGQFITKSDTNAVIASLAMTASGFMGIFGTGNFQVFYSGTSNFVVPPSISRLRIRVIGAGTNGTISTPIGGGDGGDGGGYAHAIYAVTSGASYVVTVALAGTSTTQFGSLISVTGSIATIAAQPLPKAGSSYTCAGGLGGQARISREGCGGGGAGQQIGVLGAGGNGGTGAGTGAGGQSAFSRTWNQQIGAPNLDGNRATINGGNGTNSNLNIPARFPFDTFTGGGGSGGSGGGSGGSGATGGGGGGSGHVSTSGVVVGGSGGIGGGGGGGGQSNSATTAANGGNGGIGGGGGGGGGWLNGGASSSPGLGGPGLVIVEW